MKCIEKWGKLELSFEGKTSGNPFVDFDVWGEFTSKNEHKKVSGFYDGDGKYVVRFMPSFKESYTYKVYGSFSDEIYTGEFTATNPSSNNHGPVRVVNTFHFAYEDMTPYYPVGTTCYVWTHQSDEMIEKTIETLKNGYFNKIRFCIFPKHYSYNFENPELFPYEGTPGSTEGLTSENMNTFVDEHIHENKWDFYRFNPKFFHKFESCIEKLQELNIEADIIVMHPYDRWGFKRMSADQDDLYWKYVIARFSSYRNVWWSLANEFQGLKRKTLKDWERYAQILCDYDPYTHLRSIHNGPEFYDFTKPWITHCCIQRIDVYKCAEYTNDYRTMYNKPVVIDEFAYEGNLQYGWGNISPQELVRRFWETTVRGGYASHGETYLPKDRVNGKLWWSHGGILHGESAPRIKFLRQIINETPGYGLKYSRLESDEISACAEIDNEYILTYFGFYRPSFRDYYFLDENADYHVEIIDTWNMTINDLGILHGKFHVELPGKEYMAIRIRKVSK